MADPRFYDNRGPFALAQVSSLVDVSMPAGADGGRQIADLAALEGAGPQQLAFCVGKAGIRALANSRAGFCLIASDLPNAAVPDGMIALACASVQHAFAAVARLFYPE